MFVMVENFSFIPRKMILCNGLDSMGEAKGTFFYGLLKLFFVLKNKKNLRKILRTQKTLNSDNKNSSQKHELNRPKPSVLRRCDFIQ